MTVHLPLTLPPRRYFGSLLGPSAPVAHARFHLPLLPSGPDGVHGNALHGTRASSPLAEGRP